jgi:hypothetical protein
MLLYFNDVLVNTYIPFHKENFSNIYSETTQNDFDIITKKINIQEYLQPKYSKNLFPFINKNNNKEPKPFSF